MSDWTVADAVRRDDEASELGTAADRLRVTEAGRRLHDSGHSADCWQAAEGCALIDLIAAIEAEARTSSLDDGAADRRWLPAALNVFAAAQEVRR